MQKSYRTGLFGEPEVANQLQTCNLSADCLSPQEFKKRQKNLKNIAHKLQKFSLECAMVSWF